jgi:hypothetical protein
MKIIAMGDVHGRDFWRRIVDTQEFDRLILAGDYFDSTEITAKEQMNNFRNLVAFKETFPDKLILLTGNHDLHYLPVARAIHETYSLFQEEYATEISRLLQEHFYILQMAYKWGDYLFTHAGVTQTWLNNTGYKGEEISIFLNRLFQQQPEAFLFSGTDPYGDDVTQSPVWVRPQSLKEDAFGYPSIKHVVGHTRMYRLKTEEGRFYFIDTMGATKEYLIIEDGVVSTGKISCKN